jgi:hypothetical protein
MRAFLRTALLGSLLVILAAPASAADFAAGVRAGTHGLGPELVAGVTPALHARLIGGAYDYGTTFDETGITYDADAELRSALLLLDWHPAGGGFRFSLGGGWNGTELRVTAPLQDLVRRYAPQLPPLALPGTVHGVASGSEVAPYGGLGWGRPFAGGRVAASLDLGVLYHGAPEAELTIDSPALAGQPPLVQQVLALLAADEEARLEEELRDYRYLPLVAVGVTFRF